VSRVRSEAEARSLALAVCVVDPGGHVIASARMDGAALGAVRLAVGKAYTAVLWGMPTGAFMESTQPGGADWGFNATDDRIVVYAGASRCSSKASSSAASAGAAGRRTRTKPASLPPPGRSASLRA
jgi:uncharacterized protein GlcG (DUF336 family)